MERRNGAPRSALQPELPPSLRVSLSCVYLWKKREARRDLVSHSPTAWRALTFIVAPGAVAGPRL